jgi:hypothetical protein
MVIINILSISICRKEDAAFCRLYDIGDENCIYYMRRMSNIISDDFNNHCQVDLVDLQASASNLNSNQD